MKKVKKDAGCRFSIKIQGKQEKKDWGLRSREEKGIIN